ncbi:MAG: hypothetical protein LRY53_11705 [Burkholderiaceae bacterium]|nr:hypothetical protein [Burkholderiaceae bacterium]MCD8515736.1 hypothetical protein [Burkholderiaceae bacterium]MCD8536583.1 hypothetical protein [Burkholderiaceae bacterium]MCD8566254.1 hypothetical protein [Burkholderiaceae bacterium]
MRTSSTFKKSIPLAALLTSALLLAGCANLTQPATPENISVFPKPTYWQALSRTASGITGDITLTDTQLTFGNQASISISPIEHDADAGQTLFRVTSKTNPELLNGNLLCGNNAVDYLVVQISGDVPGQSDMQLMAYYYPEQLHLKDLPLKNLDDIKRQMCALYTYVGMASQSVKAR